MTRIALGVEYHGAAFFGWQTQRHLRTAQGELTKALSQVADHTIEVVCAGRTDKGVHALGQVVHFDSVANRPAHSWLLGANALMSADIAVKWVQLVPESFHARFSALERSYCYVIYNHRSRPACLSRQVTWINYSLDENLMSEAGQYLIGEHDFSAFRDSACQAKSPVRTIFDLSVTRQGDLILISVRANAFLHHMVRNIVGVLLAIGNKKASSQWMQKVLFGRDRALAGITAPPDGLYFIAVRYPAEYVLPQCPDIHFLGPGGN